ncbi:DUF5666 domain-containing protein [Bellilinea caldifistulae]|uniref:DUF5666 domain-containing protein n=1 Tax=Bellilinea caldifistulae TaxID=360411 RepID=A0A0P6XJQ6_9CHLR|nr:DUF5666 domain-containing protein [Bellilinea caldifistulae]KPL75200.1 hypothetical protein AC812_09530 [Bellilinea caldifistulae]
MNIQSNFRMGTLAVLAVFILLGLSACAPATVDAANTPLAAAPLNAESASFETRLARIELNGTLEQINPQSAVVDGQTFRLDEQSVVVSALKRGDRVQVKAVLLPDNSLYAQSLKLDLSASSPSSFKFYGFVEEMGNDAWRISAVTVQITSTTAIAGGIGPGSFVEVEGRILNGQLLADKIATEDSSKSGSTVTPGAPVSGEVEFYGKIESIQNGVYVIGGRTVRTQTNTEIKGALALGAMVKVHATLQADGSYLAREIELSQGDDAGKTSTPGAPVSGEVEFYGKIESIQNGVYVIGGRTVRTQANTEIKGALALGAMVKVHATLQADGSYLAREIELSQGDDNSGKSGDDNSGKSDDDDNSGKSGDDNSGKSGDDDNSGKSGDDNSGKGGDDDYGKGDDDYGKGKGK